MYSNLQPITVPTLTEYLKLTYLEAFNSLKRQLPAEFGIVVDGWRMDKTSTEFFGVFAACPGQKELTMLGLLPFEADEVNTEETPFNRTGTVLFGSAESAEIIDIILSAVDRNRSHLLFLVGDNCSTNTRLADLLEIPFIGCASHRMALEVKHYSDEADNVLAKLDLLFRELRHVKNSLILRNLTELRPLKRNATRWSSAISMIRRHLKYLELQIYDHFGPDVGRYVLCFNDNVFVRQLSDAYGDFDSITKFLQKDGTSLSASKSAFSILHAKYVTMNTYTMYNPPSSIVHSPHFENAIIKISEGNESCLTIHERNSVSRLLKEDRPLESAPRLSSSPDTSISAPQMSSSPDNSISNQLKSIRDAPSSSDYINLAFIPATSNALERLF
ncbi:hypothetical protein GEMRC1_013562 [Eukaryota sp. GEM-RC1]